jgi:hypothetical protein
MDGIAKLRIDEGDDSVGMVDQARVAVQAMEPGDGEQDKRVRVGVADV